jgi:hypothetical protein
MVESVSGSFDGKDYPAIGEEADLSDEHGAELCASGHAVPVERKAEKATARKAETRNRKGETA